MPSKQHNLSCSKFIGETHDFTARIDTIKYSNEDVYVSAPDLSYLMHIAFSFSAVAPRMLQLPQK